MLQLSADDASCSLVAQCIVQRRPGTRLDAIELGVSSRALRRIPRRVYYYHYLAHRTHTRARASHLSIRDETLKSTRDFRKLLRLSPDNFETANSESLCRETLAR